MVDYSADEAIETARRSRLPTVFTEGIDDYFIFRRLQGLVKDTGASFLPLGGKTSVLSVFDRRAELAGGQVAFIVDMDFWLFEGVPAQYHSPFLTTTNGYSIENDLYVDGEFERLLEHDEQVAFQRDRNSLCRWFAREVEIRSTGQAALVDLHVDQILDRHGEIQPDTANRRGIDLVNNESVTLISSDYKRLIRGKTLLQALLRHLSYKGRSVRHHHKSLMEMAVVNEGRLLKQIAEQVRIALSQPITPN
ncbi:MAG TPA: DUF4435 domain-containing protein [Brevundimonas sp.]|jgi:hypothetical protein|uniref:DUF4435 domain-containing protein n=1 Tax=Brevundimonas sp. TaxID=1871086 RepID=UPI002E1274A5|nr:DUF4435 domain-containing protein [Brevundimonas sp.]